MSDQTSLHLICDRDALLATLLAADAVVPTSSTKPILTNIQLQAAAGRIDITATDAQVGLRASCVGADILREGTIVVSARMLTMILKESQSPSTTLEVRRSGDQEQLHIGLSDGEFSIPLVVGETFPAVQMPADDGYLYELPTSRFADMLKQTAFAMDKDRSSAVLSGLMLAIGGGELVLCATDGKVLGEAVAKDPSFAVSEGADRLQVVIPAATVSHLSRIITGDAGRVRIGMGPGNKVVFIKIHMDPRRTVELTSRLVEGAFPPYKAALPATVANSAVFATQDLAGAVRRSSMLISSSSNRTVVMEIKGGKAVFTNLNYTAGNARIEIPVSYQGPDLRIGINATYMGEVLRIYRGERVALEFARGMILREQGATYLVMPITLPG